VSTIEQLSDEQRLRLLVGAVVDYALYVIGLDGRVVSWNAGAQRLKGYTPEEIIGQPFSRFFTPADLEAGLPERALRVARDVGRFEAEGWRVRKDGSRFWADAILDAIRDDTGEVIGFVKITRDLSERQQAQQELLESERRYRLLINTVVDYAIFQLGPDGTVTTWNSGAQRIKGYAPHEIIGQHFSRFYTPEERAAGVPDQALEIARFERTRPGSGHPSSLTASRTKPARQSDLPRSPVTSRSGCGRRSG
jgi:PAS domain S-box-containing protein